MFSNKDWKINVSTVGEMIEELSLLDASLPVEVGFSKSVDIVIFNRERDDIHVSFSEGLSFTFDIFDALFY